LTSVTRKAYLLQQSLINFVSALTGTAIGNAALLHYQITKRAKTHCSDLRFLNWNLYFEGRVDIYEGN
jgi:hypothetical protein